MTKPSPKQKQRSLSQIRGRLEHVNTMKLTERRAIDGQTNDTIPMSTETHAMQTHRGSLAAITNEISGHDGTPRTPF
jgi:hypothetical protein